MSVIKGTFHKLSKYFVFVCINYIYENKTDICDTLYTHKPFDFDFILTILNLYIQSYCSMYNKLFDCRIRGLILIYIVHVYEIILLLNSLASNKRVDKSPCNKQNEPATL